jgi:hypothetical protein
MIDQLQARLAELKAEYQLGDARLRELMRTENTLRETLLRLSGAIQVLEELLGKSPETTPPADTATRAGENGTGENGTGQREVLTVS